MRLKMTAMIGASIMVVMMVISGRQCNWSRVFHELQDRSHEALLMGMMTPEY